MILYFISCSFKTTKSATNNFSNSHGGTKGLFSFTIVIIKENCRYFYFHVLCVETKYGTCAC